MATTKTEPFDPIACLTFPQDDEWKRSTVAYFNFCKIFPKDDVLIEMHCLLEAFNLQWKVAFSR